jgi:hypothetical protein
VEPVTRGDPESALRWTCKSVRKLAAELREQGHRVSHHWVAEQVRDLGYSLQGNRKTREGSEHPDRDAQFGHINATAQAFLVAGDPVMRGGHQEERTGRRRARTAGASGGPRVSRRRCGCTTL